MLLPIETQFNVEWIRIGNGYLRLLMLLPIETHSARFPTRGSRLLRVI